MTDFPNSPVTDDTFTANGIEYIFDGTKWKTTIKKYSYNGSVLSNTNNITNIDLSSGNFFELNLSEQTEVQFSNPPAAGKAQIFYLKLGINTGYQDVNGFDLSVASYDNVSSSTPIPDNIEFKNDGSKLYVVYSTPTIDRIYQYTLSTPWDLSTIVYDGVYLSVNSQETAPQGIEFKPDGTKLYMVGYNTNNGIHQYDLTIPWDISSASYSKSFVLGSQDNAPQDVTFKSDGTKMFFVGTSNEKVYQYSLSIPWEIDSLSYDSVDFSIFTPQQFSYAVEFNNTGTKMFVLTAINDTIHEYDLSTPWDLTSVTYSSVSFSFNSEDSSPSHFTFKNNGSKLYMVGTSTNKLYQYSTATTDTVTNITWPNSVIWETGSAPTLPDLGQTDLLEFTTSDGGTTYYAKLAEDNIS